MRALRRLVARLANLVTGRRCDERLREEIESHIASAAQDNIRSGMTPEEAIRNARLKLGPVESLRESYHAEESVPFLESLLSDGRYALRVLRKSPTFTAVAVVTLMLGIAANVVVFGVVDAVLLHPLEVRDPQSLYQVRHKQWMMGRLLTTSYPAFEDLRRRNSTFSGMVGIYAYSHARLKWQNLTLGVSGEEVTGNYFDVLGVKPALGRFFHAADEHGDDSAPYVVLSDALWRNQFQADPGIVGSAVELNAHQFTVLGIAPAQFHGTERFVWPDYWVPIVNQAQVEGWNDLHNRAAIMVTVIGRLKSGISPRQATDDLNAIVAEMAKEYPQSDEGVPLRLIHPGLIGDEGEVIRDFLYGISALALLVLAAACANLASLFAGRAVDRSRELALRLALGSSRRRLVRQLMTEAVILSMAGGAVGFGAAALLFHELNRWLLFMSNHLVLAMDERVCAAGLAFTMGSAFLFGILPARHAWHSSPIQSLKNEPLTRRYLARFTMRDLLLAAQIAICTLLVTASLVAVRGLIQALDVKLGFQPQGAMLANLDLGQAATDDRLLEKQKAVIDALGRIPGMTAVGAVNRTPFTGGLHGVPIFQPGTTDFKLRNSVLSPYVFQMSPGYLGAAGTRLLQGRDFSWHDTAQTPLVAIVNQTFARNMWATISAIGQHFVINGKLTEVVGVVEDGKYHDLQESPQPVVYLALSQDEQSGVVFVARSQRPLNESTAALQRTLRDIEPNTPVSVQSWTTDLEGELFSARAAMVALGVMGLMATLVALTGIFGMAAYTVSRRMKELGIRVALGARRVQVMSAGVGRPMVLLGVGSAAGLLAGMLAKPLLGRLVYQANPRAPLVVVGVVLFMIVLGLVASAIPARRALAVDPSNLLREE